MKVCQYFSSIANLEMYFADLAEKDGPGGWWDRSYSFWWDVNGMEWEQLSKNKLEWLEEINAKLLERKEP